MTDILLSNAKNMYAKDEKSIFQGVYNLLYGTVALIMVSSEDAAVDGDTRLLSPNQVKVRVLKKVSEKKKVLLPPSPRSYLNPIPIFLGKRHCPGIDEHC